jgi:hypothetical protein
MTSSQNLPRLLSRRAIINAAGFVGAAAVLPRAAGSRTVAQAVSSPFLAALLRIERKRILPKAERLVRVPVETVTSHHAVRSPGDKHAYYSEADYWWPDPANAAAPYIRRDGRSYPMRFEAHRSALIRLSRIVPWLASAHRLTGKRRYLDAMQRHLDAWFVNDDTRMAPHLDHAQAIIGVNTGRGIGVIDTLHLVEVARAARYAAQLGQLRNAEPIARWFRAYLNWMK